MAKKKTNPTKKPPAPPPQKDKTILEIQIDGHQVRLPIEGKTVEVQIPISSNEEHTSTKSNGMSFEEKLNLFEENMWHLSMIFHHLKYVIIYGGIVFLILWAIFAEGC